MVKKNNRVKYKAKDCESDKDFVSKPQKRHSVLDLYNKYEKIINSIVKYIGYCLGAVVLTQYLSYTFSSNLNEKQNNMQLEYLLLQKKIDIKNKLDRSISTLYHSMRYVINDMKGTTPYDRSRCIFFLHKYRIDNLEDYMLENGYDLKFLFGKSAKEKGKSFVSWFNEHKIDCFSTVDNPKIQLKQKADALINSLTL